MEGAFSSCAGWIAAEDEAGGDAAEEIDGDPKTRKNDKVSSGAVHQDIPESFRIIGCPLFKSAWL